MRMWQRLGSVLIASLGLVSLMAAQGEAQDRQPPPKRDDARVDARMLADLEILRDLELLRQLDVLQRLDVRSQPTASDAKTDAKGKP